MTRHITRAALVAVTIAGLTGAAEAQTATITRTIPMEAGGEFTLSNISGDITVRGVDGDDLTILATKRVSGGDSRDADEALRRVEVDIRQRGNRVMVETEYRRTRGDSRVSVDYEIGVPRSIGVRIESIAGDVSVEGVDGRTRVEVVGGEVRLTSLARLVEAEAIAGNIILRDVASNDELTVDLVAGSLTAEGVRAPRFEASTVAGSITLIGVESRRVEVDTLAGSVTFEGPLASDGRYEFGSHSGRVLLRVPDGSGFELEAESFSGDFSSNLPIMTRGGTREATVFGRGVRTIEGTAGGGGARLEITTFSGNITIETR